MYKTYYQKVVNTRFVYRKGQTSNKKVKLLIQKTECLQNLKLHELQELEKEISNTKNTEEVIQKGVNFSISIIR